MAASLSAGVLSGVVGLGVFLVVHHFWIKPIWFIAPAGLAIAVMGGLAIGWSFFHVRAGLPARPWTAVGMLGLIMGILLPGILLSFTHGPLFDLATATVPSGQGVRVAVRFAVELLLTSAVMGALAGAWLGRTSIAAAATCVAGLAFAIGPGHNIPMFGTNPATWKGLALVLIVACVSSVALVEGTALMEKR